MTPECQRCGRRSDGVEARRVDGETHRLCDPCDDAVTRRGARRRKRDWIGAAAERF